MYLRGFLHLQMSHPLASTSKPCSQYMAHIISGQTEMIEHVDVFGLFVSKHKRQKTQGTVCIGIGI
jgi:hypothetical protein